jgi:hypothetical protein
MQKTKDILNWYFNPLDFKHKAEHLFSSNTKNQVSNSVLKMKELAIRLPEGSKLPETKLIDDIYNLFQSKYKEEYSVFLSLFSKRDVRVLVWTLDYKPSDSSQIILFSEQFETAKRIITDKWKDSFIISLWHILLKNWNVLQNHKEQRIGLANLLNAKCSEYNRSRKDILNISTNINLFLKHDSPKEYTNRLLKRKILISEANSLINQKESVLVYEYFSNVIEKYVERIEGNNIEQKSTLAIYQFLLKQNSKKTKLLICSYLINNKKFSKVTEIIKSQTVNMLGDPVKKYLWKYSGLSENQETNIELARNKLNVLLNKDFIDVFFEGLVQDDRRKEYWLKFIDKINDIKFVGNRANYRYLKNIESISKFVDSRYKATSRNQATCALIIYSQDYIFVEFSDTGALYIYKHQSFKVNLNNIRAIDDLKLRVKDSYACKNNLNYGHSSHYSSNDKFLMNSEGRITHQGENWELRVNAWMLKYYHD